MIFVVSQGAQLTFIRKWWFMLSHGGPKLSVLGKWWFLVSWGGAQLTFLRKWWFLVSHGGPQLTLLRKCSFLLTDIQTDLLKKWSFFRDTQPLHHNIHISSLSSPSPRPPLPARTSTSHEWKSYSHIIIIIICHTKANIITLLYEPWRAKEKHTKLLLGKCFPFKFSFLLPCSSKREFGIYLKERTIIEL